MLSIDTAACCILAYQTALRVRLGQQYSTPCTACIIERPLAGVFISTAPVRPLSQPIHI